MITLSYQRMTNKRKSTETWVCHGSEIASTERWGVGVDRQVRRQSSFSSATTTVVQPPPPVPLRPLPSLDEEWIRAGLELAQAQPKKN